jgi:hypothetical protein
MDKKISLVFDANAKQLIKNITDVSAKIEELIRRQEENAALASQGNEKAAIAYEKVNVVLGEYTRQQQAYRNMLQDVSIREKTLLEVLKEKSPFVKKAADGYERITEKVVSGIQGLEAYKAVAKTVSKVLEDFKGPIETVKTAFANVKDGIGSFVSTLTDGIAESVPFIGSVKAINAALAANPYAAVAQVLIEFINILKSSAGTADGMRVAFAALNGAVKPIMDAVRQFGKLLMDNITNPGKIVDGVIANLMNRVKGLGQIFVKLANGDFKGAGDAALQAATGITNLADKVQGAAKKVGEFGNEMVNSAKKAAQAQSEINALNKSMEQNERRNAEGALKIGLLNKKVAEGTKGFGERIKAVKAVGEISKEMARRDVEQVNLQIQALERRRAIEGDTEQLSQELKKANIALLEKQTGLVQAVAKAEGDLKQIRTQAADAAREQRKRNLNDQIAGYDIELEKAETTNERKAEILVKQYELKKKFVALDNDLTKNQVLLEQQRLDDKLKEELAKLKESEAQKQEVHEETTKKLELTVEQRKRYMQLFYEGAAEDSEEYMEGLKRLAEDWDKFLLSGMASFDDYITNKYNGIQSTIARINSEVAAGITKLTDEFNKGFDVSKAGYKDAKAHEEQLLQKKIDFLEKTRQEIKANGEIEKGLQKQLLAELSAKEDAFIKESTARIEAYGEHKLAMNARAAEATLAEAGQYIDQFQQATSFINDIASAISEADNRRVEELQQKNEQIKDDTTLTEKQRKDLIEKNEKEIQEIKQQSAEQQEAFAGFSKSIALFELGVKTAQSIAAAIAGAAEAATAAGPAAPFALIGYIGSMIAAVVGAFTQASSLLSSSNQPKAPQFAQGGYVEVGGRPHAQGGTKYFGEDGNAFEVEHGERIYVLKTTASNHLRGLSALNQSYGGHSWFNAPVSHAAQGGAINDGGFFLRSVSNSADTSVQLQAALTEAMSKAPAPILRITELERITASRNRSIGVSEL